jgi:transposase InsO family protein
MADQEPLRSHERWAQLRFSIVGPLLAAPPGPGELRGEIEQLAAKQWRHPITGQPVRFGFSTIERWYYQAHRAKTDPVGVLRRKIRRDAGTGHAVGEGIDEKLRQQYTAHPNWSYQLHYDNLRAQVAADPKLGPLASYSTLRRFMQAEGLLRRRRLSGRKTRGAKRAERRLEQREVRSFEVECVHGLWHLDYHHGSRKIVTAAGEWVTPLALGILDDRSRLACHVQWYLAETAENLVHGLCQAFQKRALPRALMTDNGAAMTAAETTAGLGRLGILHRTILPYSAYQNAKQEVFWAQLEGRLLAMLEGVDDLSLALLNEATQAWVEMEYQRRVHSETGQTPLERCLAGPDVGRPCPESADLRLAFTSEQRRIQRRSDGTVTLCGRRFEVPARFRPLRRVCLRYAAWDLTQVHLACERTGKILGRLWPLDRARNADSRRRALPGTSNDPSPQQSGMAPLLRQLMADYAATGLPPAYLPKIEEDRPETNPIDREEKR